MLRDLWPFTFKITDDVKWLMTLGQSPRLSLQVFVGNSSLTANSKEVSKLY